MLWALVPALSLGLLSFAPFAHAAVRLRSRALGLAAAAYAAAPVLLIGPVGEIADTGDLGASLFTASWLALIVGPTTHALLIRRRVFFAPPPDPAVAAALAGRDLRQQARAILAVDPALGRELRIGRPDLPRRFDDGGLVDVNHVPAEVLVDQLGLLPAEAARVVEARDHLGRFTSPTELAVYAELPEATVEAVRERLLFLGGDPASQSP